MTAFHFFSCHEVMTSYFRIGDVFNFLLNFTRSLPIVYSCQVSASSDLNQERISRKPPSLIMFLAKHSLINWLPWQQSITYPKVSNFRRLPT